MSNEKPTTYELISWAYVDYQKAQNQRRPEEMSQPRPPQVVKAQGEWEDYQRRLKEWTLRQNWYNGEIERINTEVKRAKESLLAFIPSCGVWFKMYDDMYVGKYHVPDRSFWERKEYDELVVQPYKKHMVFPKDQYFIGGVLTDI